MTIVAGLVSAAELGVVPARDLVRGYFENYAFRGAVDRAAAPAFGAATAVVHDLAHRVDILNDLAGAAHHYAAQFGIAAAGLDHQTDLGVAADVQHLLRLGVGGHVKGAVFD